MEGLGEGGGWGAAHINGTPSTNDRCETGECTGRKVTRKHGNLGEIAYETFRLAPPQRGGETAVVCWLQTKSVVRWEPGSVCC